MNTPKLGERMSECAACHRYFTTTANFDKHRAWTDGIAIWQGKNRPAEFDKRTCVDPAHPSVGLFQRDNGAWGSPPMTEEQKQARGWVA